MPSKTVNIEVGSVALRGDLFEQPFEKDVKSKLVIFAHGSGSSRLSPRNQFVAKSLQGKVFGTLLFDLLTEKEDQDYEMRFDIELLAQRLEDVTNWVIHSEEAFEKAHIGYFGASTGAAAALIAASELGSNIVEAVVSRGGRPDMAGPYLRKVTVPTLLIVGGRDEEVIQLNKFAFQELSSHAKNLIIVPGATHLFEEVGTLEMVAKHAAEWFQEYL